MAGLRSGSWLFWGENSPRIATVSVFWVSTSIPLEKSGPEGVGGWGMCFHAWSFPHPSRQFHNTKAPDWATIEHDVFSWPSFSIQFLPGCLPMAFWSQSPALTNRYPCWPSLPLLWKTEGHWKRAPKSSSAVKQDLHGLGWVQTESEKSKANKLTHTHTQSKYRERQSIPDKVNAHCELIPCSECSHAILLPAASKSRWLRPICFINFLHDILHYIQG